MLMQAHKPDERACKATVALGARRGTRCCVMGSACEGGFLSLDAYLEKLVAVHAAFVARRKTRVLELFAKYDTNGDGVFDPDEFEAMVLELMGPKMEKEQILRLYRHLVALNPGARGAFSTEAFEQLLEINAAGANGASSASSAGATNGAGGAGGASSSSTSLSRASGGEMSKDARRALLYGAGDFQGGKSQEQRADDAVAQVSQLWDSMKASAYESRLSSLSEDRMEGFVDAWDSIVKLQATARGAAARRRGEGR